MRCWCGFLSLEKIQNNALQLYTMLTKVKIMKSEIISTRVPGKLKELIVRQAIRDRRTVGQQLRIIVEDYFDKPMRRARAN
jgi:hypothetical protein